MQVLAAVFAFSMRWKFCRYNTPWVKKVCHPNHGYHFFYSWSICKILLLLQSAVNFQQNQYYITLHTLSVLLH